jgi:hypothetical protein
MRSMWEGLGFRVYSYMPLLILNGYIRGKKDRPEGMARGESIEASPYSASTLHRYELPYDCAKLEVAALLASCR